MRTFFGADWRSDPRRRVIHDGIDAAAFDATNDEGSYHVRTVREEFAVPPHARLVLHVGNFNPAKNHHALVRVATELASHRSDIVFLLIGDGPLRPEIEREIASRGLMSTFRLAGSRSDVARLLQAGDLFVFPSRWEGLPGAVLEALAAGLQVVASPIAPVLEIARLAPAVTTVDPENPEAFASAVELALGTSHVGAQARRSRLPSMFTVEVSMEQLLECYQ